MLNPLPVLTKGFNIIVLAPRLVSCVSITDLAPFVIAISIITDVIPIIIPNDVRSVLVLFLNRFIRASNKFDSIYFESTYRTLPSLIFIISEACEAISLS